jgi:microcystin-dependent protein
MASPYLGEIRMFAGTFAPRGWAFCEGQELRIEEADALFALIGTTYGGDGITTFRLPDLRGRVPLHTSGDVPIGVAGGVETVTLTAGQVPAHTHAFLATTAPGTDPSPGGSVLAASPNIDRYREAAAATPMAPNALAPVGGAQPHTNLQPYLCVHFIICLQGIFPVQV